MVLHMALITKSFQQIIQMSDQITLISKDGQIFTTSIKFSQLSEFVARVIQDYSNEPIELKQISSSTMQKILAYSHYHNFTLPPPPQRPLKSNDLSQNIPDPWDVQFISELAEEDLIDLISAANYLDMRSLLELCLASVANSFKDKTLDQLKQIYNIEEDLTPEVEEQLKREYPWALELGNYDDN